MARWRQPWYSNPIAKGVGATADAAGAAAGAAAAATAGADVCASTGNTAGAGVQAKNGDNTKAAATATTVPERGEREETGMGAAGGADTTLDISYPSARNPLTS